MKILITESQLRFVAKSQLQEGARKIDYLPFEKAREYMINQKLHGVEAFREYVKLGKKPENIPSTPNKLYSDKWTSWGDFLGTNRISNKLKGNEFWPFEKAREYVRSLNIQSQPEYYKWAKSGNKPNYIPYSPDDYYGDEFKGYGDWIGTHRMDTRTLSKQFLPFEESRKFARNLNIKNREDWNTYSMSGKKPTEVPARPDEAYPDKFISWGDWLGTHFIGNKIKSLLVWDYDRASEYVRRLNFLTYREFANWARTDKRPIHMPFHPEVKYKGKGWTNWYEFLVGSPYVTDTEFSKQYSIKDKPKKYVSFLVAKDLARYLNLKSKEEWYGYIKEYKPESLPMKPQELYKEHWKGWEDFLNITE